MSPTWPDVLLLIPVVSLGEEQSVSKTPIGAGLSYICPSLLPRVDKQARVAKAAWSAAAVAGEHRLDKAALPSLPHQLQRKPESPLQQPTAIALSMWPNSSCAFEQDSFTC